MEAEQNMVE
jgi:hypothetical protein